MPGTAIKSPPISLSSEPHGVAEIQRNRLNAHIESQRSDDSNSSWERRVYHWIQRISVDPYNQRGFAFTSLKERTETLRWARRYLFEPGPKERRDAQVEVEMAIEVSKIAHLEKAKSLTGSLRVFVQAFPKYQVSVATKKRMFRDFKTQMEESKAILIEHDRQVREGEETTLTHEQYQILKTVYFEIKTWVEAR